MKSEEIKNECELMYEQIEKAKNRLEELRAICKHENTYKGNYSYRIGSITPAIICSDCGSLIKYVEDFSNDMFVSNSDIIY